MDEAILYPLSSTLDPPPSGLAYKQFLRVPERVGEDSARAVIADALIGRQKRMARDDGDDRRLFGENSLNFVEGCATAIRVSLAGLLREQVVNPGFPGGRGLRLLRAPSARGAAAAQVIDIGGRIRFGDRHYEKTGVIIVTFRNAAIKIAGINRSQPHLDTQLTQVSLDYYCHVFERLAR